MKSTIYTLSVLGFSAVALGQEIIFDQIGPVDGTGIGTNITGCQYFEEAYAQYSIASMDNVSFDNATSIGSVEMVLNGWNGFVDPSGVTAYQSNLYSSVEAAAVNLVGDISSSDADAADSTTSPDWAGGGFLVSAPSNHSVNSGSYYFSMIPTNEFATNGQTGVADSNIGDGVYGYQANPGGGFGMPDNYQETTNDVAFRLYDNSLTDPCSLPLAEECVADVDGDLVVAVSDVLVVIANWGITGDGTFRPTGDIAPAPNGDCTVDVSDLLAVIAAWGEDCRPMGACCYENGDCMDNMLAADCSDAGGLYLGDDSLCADSSCGAGACCIDETQCTGGISDWYCEVLGGVYRGAGTDCATVSCDSSCKAVGCQSPDQEGHGSGGTVGATSDLNPSAGYQVADTFSPSANGAVSSVCWWGFYIDFGGPADCGIDGPGTGDNFTIEYYADDADGYTPGTMIAGPFSVVSSVTPTGDVIPSGIGDLIQYQYTASHEPVKVEAGQCYWISIYNNKTESCFWLWETAPPGDERSAQNNAGWGSADYDVAFCVDIDITSDGCGAYTGACCVSEDCQITTVSECLALEGEYYGDNMSCEDVNNCQPIPGACCFDAVSCLDGQTDSECVAFGGTYMGPNTECDDVDCDIQPLPYDQIGMADGSDLSGNISASQFFEADFAAYDIATLDNFVFDEATTINTIESVINGWNGYNGIEGITNYTISIYSSSDAAGADLVGDVYSIDIVEPNYPTWTGAGTLVSFPVTVELPAGEYWYAIIPWNEFGTNGQTGIAGSNLGDGEYYQANPAGGFGWGTPTQAGAGNAAYRLLTD
ncbi:MAG: hypothetical protein VX615_04555 [Planctomycetota bacterium]|nr:hypothetical protein [Planctomycetota bacterium]